jgi:uncharacterized membrane protein
MIRRYGVAYLGTGLVLAGLDAIWLVSTNGIYRGALRAVLTTGFRPIPAVLFYLLYILGLTIFAVAPAIGRGGVRAAAVRGALFGLFCYSTYDLTNQATLVVWATRITLMDLAWGMFLSTVGASAGYLASTLVKPSR